ncbi:MAG TPA: hypothetical protein VKR82_00535 [Candidatus Acidoferrales bacterium]|nr:hypothetical protein [Candidatus Acidoferrales bacterium]
MRGTANRATAGASREDWKISRGAIRAEFGVILFACSVAMIAPAAAAHQDYLGQQQSPSLGEIARRLRAEKQPAKESAQIWTNENIPTNPFAISVVGQPPPPPPPPEPVPGAADAAKPKTKLENELDKAKEELAGLEKELDLAKRDLALQQQAFYTNPLASQDTAGQAKLADAQTAIDAKAADVEKAKARVADLQQRVDGEKKGSPTTDTSSPGI